MDEVALRAELSELVVGRVGEGRSVVLAGEMGVGKSHLLATAVAALRANDWVCTSIWANPAAATIPFGALAAFTTGGDGGDRLEMLRSTVATLREIGDGRNHVIALDDAPLLDDQSIAVLHQLCAEASIPVLATARSSDVERPTLTAFWKEIVAERFLVEPLDDDAAAWLASTKLSQPTRKSSVIGEIVERAAGNPLFIEELARAASENSPGGLTPRLRDVVGARIDRLDRATQHQLLLVAVADPLDTDLDVVDSAMLDRLERAGLVSTADDGDDVLARPAHPLYGEIARDGLSALQRKAIARELTDAMQSRPTMRRGDALRLAGWLRACGDVPSADLAVPAALEAIALLDADLANELVSIATSVEPGYDALFAAGEIARLTGDVDRALAWFERAFEVAAVDDEIRKVGVAMGQLHGFFRSEPDEAVRVLGVAVDRLENPVQRLELSMERSMFAAMLGRYEDVLVSARRVLTHPDCEDVVRWTACSNVAWAEAQLIDLREIDEHLETAVGIATSSEVSLAGQLDLVFAVRVNALMERGRFGEAVSSAAEFLDGVGLPGEEPAGLTAFSLSQVEWMRGEAEACRHLVDVSLEHLEAFDAFNAFPFVCGSAAIVAVTDGDVERAAGLVDAAVERHGGDGMWDRIWLGRARGWLAAADGDIDGALDSVVVAGDAGIETTHLGWALLALHDTLAWGAAERVVDRLDGLRERMHDAPFFEQLAESARPLVDEDVEAGCSGIEQLRSVGAVWHAGVVSAGLAMLCEKLGRDVEACRHATAARLWMSPTCPQHEIIERTALSNARLAVVQAAVAGKTSRQIADERFLSIRTVDNHLGAAYSALGVSGRSELVSAFSF